MLIAYGHDVPKDGGPEATEVTNARAAIAKATTK